MDVSDGRSSYSSQPSSRSYPTALALLTADGPYESDTAKLMLYGQFVGSWEVESTSFHADGTCTKWHGHWHFAWVLGGRGVLDVLQVAGAPAHELGTSLRCYDEWRDVWHIAWMAPCSGEFAHLVGRQRADRIVQEGTEPDPRRLERWTFSAITPTTFIWRGEVSSDHGRTWSLDQEMRAVRCTGCTER